MLEGGLVRPTPEFRVLNNAVERALAQLAPLVATEEYIGYVKEIAPPRLGSPTFALATIAAQVLGQRKEPAAFAPLADAFAFYADGHHYYHFGDLYPECEGKLLQALASSLTEFGDRSILPCLRKGLGCAYGDVRLKVAESVAKLGESQWLEVIKGDDDDFSRLAKSGSPHAVAILRQLLDATPNLSSHRRDRHRDLVSKALMILGEQAEETLDLLKAGNEGHSATDSIAVEPPTPVAAKQQALSEQQRAKALVEQLIRAADEGCRDEIELLLKQGVDVNGHGAIGHSLDTTALHQAARKGHRDIAALLLEQHADVNATADEMGGTPLHSAAFYGQKEVAELLLSKGADISAQSRGKITPLHKAAYSPFAGCAAVAELLIRHGADLNARQEGDGWLPLHGAAAGGTKETALVLLRSGAAVEAKDNRDGRTALHLAADKGRRDLVELLLENGADVNGMEKWGRTALHCAAYAGHKDIVELLLSRGADVNAGGGIRPLSSAMQGEHEEVIHLLRSRGAQL
jgi:ankyrin repeat protein